MNEQIRLQGDILGEEYDGFGIPKNPKCTGAPLDKIDRVDCSRIDLSEWIALLRITRNLPTDETVNLRASPVKVASSTWMATGSTRSIA